MPHFYSMVLAPGRRTGIENHMRGWRLGRTLMELQELANQKSTYRESNGDAVVYNIAVVICMLFTKCPIIRMVP